MPSSKSALLAAVNIEADCDFVETTKQEDVYTLAAIIDAAMGEERKVADGLAAASTRIKELVDAGDTATFGRMGDYLDDLDRALAAYRAARGHAPDCPVITEWDSHWGYGNKDIGCMLIPPICKCGFDAASNPKPEEPTP